jgi:hypothetical protein
LICGRGTSSTVSGVLNACRTAACIAFSSLTSLLHEQELGCDVKNI